MSDLPIQVSINEDIQFVLLSASESDGRIQSKCMANCITTKLSVSYCMAEDFHCTPVYVYMYVYVQTCIGNDRSNPTFESI